MSARKTPVLLRRTPLSGGVAALTRYTYKNDGRVLQAAADGKHDVTADFDALVCEMLLDDAPDTLPILQTFVEGGTEFTTEDRLQIGEFYDALVRIVRRHNAGPHVKRDSV